MTFLGKLVKAHPQIENHRGRQGVGIINISSVVGPILKSLSNRGAVDVATLRVSGPVIAIFGIKAVVVLSKDRLFVANAMIDAGEPRAVFFVANHIREIVALRAIVSSGGIRQRVELKQGRRCLIEEGGRNDVARWSSGAGSRTAKGRADYVAAAG